MRQRHSKPVLQYPGRKPPGGFSLNSSSASFRKEILKSQRNPAMINSNGQELSACNVCDRKENRHAKKGPSAGPSVCLAGI